MTPTRTEDGAALSATPEPVPPRRETAAASAGTGVDDGKKCGVDAGAECQGQQSGGGDAGKPNQKTDTVTDVLPQSLHGALDEDLRQTVGWEMGQALFRGGRGFSQKEAGTALVVAQIRGLRPECGGTRAVFARSTPGSRHPTEWGCPISLLTLEPLQPLA